MGTDADCRYSECLAAMENKEWSAVLEGVGVANAWVQAAAPGDPRIDAIVFIMAGLASHPKWEIRRAVAHAATHSLHAAFDPVLAKLAIDDNARVRQAAERAAFRRRDARHASMLGKQHEERINSVLDDIEVRFGILGREAAKRAGEEIANTFARELYHEVIKLLTPLAISAERLHEQLGANARVGTPIREEARRVEQQVHQLRAVLDAMRAYTHLPRLKFTVESLREVAEEAAALAWPQGSCAMVPSIEVDIAPSIVADVARPRMVQALSNILANAVESYEGGSSTHPVRVLGEERDGYVRLSIQDRGCGMSDEALVDARTLFATSKLNGTGFGLPLAIKIVESEHGGRLNLESQLGVGTTVRIIIPINRARGAE